MITGEQQYRKTHLPQGGNGSGTGFPGRIGDGDEPQGGGADEMCIRDRTWIPEEYELNRTYGWDKAAFSPYLTEIGRASCRERV